MAPNLWLGGDTAIPKLENITNINSPAVKATQTTKLNGFRFCLFVVEF